MVGSLKPLKNSNLIILIIFLLFFSIALLLDNQKKEKIISEISKKISIERKKNDNLEMKILDFESKKNITTDKKLENLNETEFQKSLSEIFENVKILRKLDGEIPKNISKKSKEEIKDFVKSDLLSKKSSIDSKNSLYKILFLVPKDFSYFDILVQTFQEQVAGFYNSTNKSLVVVSENEKYKTPTISDAETYILSHEFIHVLQDQNFGLDNVLNNFSDDSLIARTALVEGDATYFMNLYKDKFNLKIINSSSELVSSKNLEKAPFVVWQDIVFPYTEGYDFVSKVISQKGDLFINDLYKNPPSSTEQIIHPEKYFSREIGEDIVFNLNSIFSEKEWIETDSFTGGELFFRTFFRTHIGDNFDYCSEGWNGDKIYFFQSYENSNFKKVIFLNKFDSEKDKIEFLDCLNSVRSKNLNFCSTTCSINQTRVSYKKLENDTILTEFYSKT